MSNAISTTNRPASTVAPASFVDRHGPFDDEDRGDAEPERVQMDRAIDRQGEQRVAK